MEPTENILDTAAAGPSAVRGGIVRVAGYGAGVAVSTVSAAVLFRHLGVVDSGRYVLVLSLVTLSSGLTDAGLSSLGVRQLSLHDDPRYRDSFVRDLLGLRIAFTTLGSALACLYAAVAGYGTVLVAGAAVVGIATLATNVQSALSTALMARLRLKAVTAADLLRQGVIAIAVILLTVAGAGLITFFWTNVAGGVAALALTAVLVRGHMPFRPSLSLARWRTLLAQALPFALAAAVGALYFRLAIVLVALLSSPRQVGLFGASFRMVEVLIVIPGLVVSSGFPIFARAAHGDRARLEYGLQRMLDACVILGTGVALLLCVGAPVAIQVVAGPHFAAATPVLRLHALALLFSFSSALFGYALISLRAYRSILAMTLAALLVSATAALLLIPTEGATGGAVATLVGEATLVLVGALALRRVRGGSQLWPSAAFRILLAAGLGASPALVLPALAALVTAGPIFLGALLVLRALPQELLVEARGIRSRGRRDQ